MWTPNNRLVAAVVAVALLLTGAAGGAAVATGKIKANQIAKNAIRTKHLKAGNVTGDKLAAGAVTADKVAAATLTGDKLATNTLTGAQIDEATLGRVPDAAAIAGTKVTPISVVRPNTDSSFVTVATGPGWILQVSCPGTQEVVFSKTGSSSLVTGHRISGSGVITPVVAPASAGGTFPSATSQEWHLVSLTADGSTTTVDLFGVFAPGQFTSQTDCFVSGTVATRP